MAFGPRPGRLSVLVQFQLFGASSVRPYSKTFASLTRHHVASSKSYCRPQPHSPTQAPIQSRSDLCPSKRPKAAPSFNASTTVVSRTVCLHRHPPWFQAGPRPGVDREDPYFHDKARKTITCYGQNWLRVSCMSTNSCGQWILGPYSVIFEC